MKEVVDMQMRVKRMVKERQKAAQRASKAVPLNAAQSLSPSSIGILANTGPVDFLRGWAHFEAVGWDEV